MSAVAPLHDRIGTLRVLAGPRQSVRRPPELSAIALHPSGLPRSAILLMRRVRLERAFPLSTACRATLPVSTWREAAQAAVIDGLRDAARPILGPVPSGCGAVLFADTAELLACLARDWLDNTLHRHWWWRDLIARPTPEAVRAAWLAEPSALAAACELLQQEGRLDAFVATWPSAEVRRLAVASSRGVPEPWAMPAGAESSGVPRSRAEVPRDVPAIIVARGPKHGPQTAERDVVPPHDAVPATLHSTAKTRGVAARRSETGFASTGVARIDASVIASNEAVDEPAATSRARGVARASVASGQPDSSVVDRSSWTLSIPIDDGPEDIGREAPIAMSPRDVDETRDVELVVAGPPHVAEATRPTSSPRPTSTPVDPFDIGATTVVTAFGGLFYLLNVALYLDLYGDFTEPDRRGLPLSPWALVAAIGRRWFGNALRRDPLWDALCRLAGQSSASPLPWPIDFAPPPWQVEPAWLVPFDAPSSLLLRRGTRRIRLDHPAGFTLFERDVDAVDAAWTTTWLAGHPTLVGVPIVEMSVRDGSRSIFRRASRWVAHLAAYVQARCAVALDVDRRDAPALVARHAARVVSTPATIEVHLSLAMLPLAIRHAGLDRDPGWLPASGRSIRFVFD